MMSGSINHLFKPSWQRLWIATVAAVLISLAPARAAFAEGWELLMIEQPGCIYCHRWHAEIGPIYPLSPEGRFAPLRIAQLRAMPSDVSLTRRAVYTPTFVLLSDGQEMARVEGYPGDDLFWSMLGLMITKTYPEWAQTPSVERSGG